MKARTISVARGESRPGPGDPKVWFTSIESLAQILSTSNQLLLELIRRLKPQSLAELAKASGRQESNLSRTLRTMERYRLVRLTKAARGRIVPEVPYDRVAFDLPIVAGTAAVAAMARLGATG
ncbi:MAG: MarR family transcriptional regulator [Proteobacteria bacterium]|nr:MarR family transcriptional regulator [Pseudomonadota bacterium]